MVAREVIQTASGNINNVLEQVEAVRTKLETNHTQLDNLLEEVKKQQSDYLSAVNVYSQNYFDIEKEILIGKKKVDALKMHLHSVVSSTGDTNHVVVYALGYNGEGFYSAPSEALLNSLNQYLEERRLINVTHEAVSGTAMLKKVGFDVQINVKPGFIKTEVENSVRNELAGLLKNRDFGKSLYLSEVYLLVSNIKGVNFCIVKINTENDETYVEGINSGLDSDGNYILAKDEYIISKMDGDLNSVINVWAQ